MAKIIIQEWQGSVNLKISKDSIEYKLPIDTLEDIMDYLFEIGLVYGEKLGKDRLETLLFDK